MLLVKIKIQRLAILIGQCGVECPLKTHRSIVFGGDQARQLNRIIATRFLWIPFKINSGIDVLVGCKLWENPPTKISTLERIFIKLQ